MKDQKILFFAILIIFIIIAVSYLADCYWRQKIKESENYELVIPPYNSSLVYEQIPIQSFPLGYYEAIESDADVDGAVYIGTDPRSIPPGTYICVVGLGLRIAVPDKQATKKTVIIYGNVKDPKFFIWAVREKRHDAGHSRIAEL